MDIDVFSYCEQVVREQDADRYLLSQFAPQDKRAALWALFAFNYEVAKTREIVSETQLGLIRLQWWREAVAEIFEDKALREHAVVQALARVIADYDLDRDLFEKLIYAREFDLEDVLPSDLEGFLNYAEFTSAPLFALVAKILSAEGDPHSVVALNYAIAGILRATVSFARQRRCYLPQDLMTRHEVSVNKLYELKEQAGLRLVLRDVSDMFAHGVCCDDRFMKTSQKLSTLYIKQLNKFDFNVFDGRVLLPPPFKALRLVLPL